MTSNQGRLWHWLQVESYSAGNMEENVLLRAWSLERGNAWVLCKAEVFPEPEGLLFCYTERARWSHSRGRPEALRNWFPPISELAEIELDENWANGSQCWSSTELSRIDTRRVFDSVIYRTPIVLVYPLGNLQSMCKRCMRVGSSYSDQHNLCRQDHPLRNWRLWNSNLELKAVNTQSWNWRLWTLNHDPESFNFENRSFTTTPT